LVMSSINLHQGVRCFLMSAITASLSRNHCGGLTTLIRRSFMLHHLPSYHRTAVGRHLRRIWLRRAGRFASVIYHGLMIAAGRFSPPSRLSAFEGALESHSPIKPTNKVSRVARRSGRLLHCHVLPGLLLARRAARVQVWGP